MESILLFKQLQPQLFFLFVSIIGFFVGSFLNVLIFRLPIILQKEFFDDACEFLGIQNNYSNESRFSTLNGRSYCPNCEKKIPFYLNIPVLSWLMLRGKSACCKKQISIKYPATELLTGLVTISFFVFFGVEQAFFLCLAFYLLLSLAVIDFNKLLLPDTLVFTLLWVGLVANTKGIFIPLDSAVYGAVLGYVLSKYLCLAYGFIRKKDMILGDGDAKLFAACGAWLGVSNIMFVALGSTIVTLILFFLLREKIMKKSFFSRELVIPFGPGICVSMFVLLILQSININIIDIILTN